MTERDEQAVRKTRLRRWLPVAAGFAAVSLVVAFGNVMPVPGLAPQAWQASAPSLEHCHSYWSFWLSAPACAKTSLTQADLGKTALWGAGALVLAGYFLFRRLAARRT